MNTTATPMQDEGPIIRALNLNDLERCLALSTESGWNQNENDWRLLLRVCHGYGVDEPGYGLAATAMAWDLGDRQSWINMVLVGKSYRRLGFATKLMEKCHGDVSANQGVSLLDATSDGSNVYTKLGFSGEISINRFYRDHKGSGDSENPDWDESICPVLMEPEDFRLVVELDKQVLGVDRGKALIDFYLREPKAAWIAREASGALRGFILGRDGRFATQLGPIVADSRACACALLRSALNRVEGPTIVDAPSIDSEWLELLEQLGFENRRNFLRMGTEGATWPTDWSRAYAIAGPDFA